jgi:hypothetical protein
MEYGPQSLVIHGFPNLSYRDTQSVRSDPEITVYHDLVTENENPYQSTPWELIVVIGAIGVVGAISIAIFIKKRKAP